jgi:hypothetical protein
MLEASLFEKVTRSEKCLYGPRKLMLCGFPAAGQAKLDTVLGLVGIADVPKIWVTAEQARHTLADEAQLIGLMNACKKSGMQPALWACLTPVSETWPLQQLLTELAREREAMQKRK